jgi:hypothetical protein
MRQRAKRRIVVLGAGPAGLAAVDELVSAERDDVEVVLVEGRAWAGGRARSVALSDPEHAALWPEAPSGGQLPTSVFALRDEDADSLALLGFTAETGPTIGAPALALGAPDLAGGSRALGWRLVPLAPRLSAGADAPAALLDALEAHLPIVGAGWLGWWRAVLSVDELSAGCRWTLAAAASLAAADVDEDDELGPLADVELTRLVEALYARVVAGLEGAAAALSALDEDHELTRVVVADVDRLAREGFEPARSRALALLVDAARAGPDGVDAATALRALGDASARLRVVDGGNLAAGWEAARERAEAKLQDRGGRALFGSWAVQLLQTGDAVSGVELTDNAAFSAPPVPVASASRKGLATDTLDADAVISTVSAGALAPLLRLVSGDEQERFVASLRQQGRNSWERVSLLIALDREVTLPLPEGSSIARGLAGPTSTLLDLRRAWSADAVRRVRMGPDGKAARSAWLLTGAWADAFAAGPGAPPGAVREVLRRLAQDVADIDPATLDARVGGAVLGEVRLLQRTAWLQRWVEEVSPFLVGRALVGVAELPGLSPPAREELLARAERVTRSERSGVRWALWRGGALEERAPSTAPGLQRSRPVAGAQSPVRHLFCAGDWTGLEPAHDASPGVDTAMRSGRAAARAALRALADA